MIILTITRLAETFERFDDGMGPSEWNYTTNIVPFPTRKDAVSFLKKMKAEYHGKGKVASGEITGRKTTRFEGMRTLETIRTELTELDYGQELEVASEYDTGMCPFGEA